MTWGRAIVRLGLVPLAVDYTSEFDPYLLLARRMLLLKLLVPLLL